MSGSGKLYGLNPVQEEAVLHPEGPVLVLAGAGSGKTRILTHRIAHLITAGRARPSAILAVTFTNRAANEMKQRVERLVHGRAKGLWIGTFHSVCLRILKREVEKLDGITRDFVIYDEGDQLRLIRECLKELGLNERVFEPRRLRARIDRARNRSVSSEELAGEAADDLFSRRVADVYGLYQRALRRNNALDFGDLLSETVGLFARSPEVLDRYRNLFRHILVDEYQDTNRLQYELVSQLSSLHRNLFVVGDDSQSIYGWRGADINNILDFERDFPEARVIKLEQNYRSTKTILSAANALIARNRLRREKRLWTEGPRGEVLEYYEARDERDEARLVAELIARGAREGERPYRDFAVFYRTNSQSRLIEEELMRGRIPYSVVGSVGFYSRAEIKDALAFLRVVVNPRDDLGLKRIINVPPRGIGKGTVKALERLAGERSLSLFDALGVASREGILPRKATRRLEDFRRMMLGFMEFSQRNGVRKLLQRVLRDTGYWDSLKGDEERLGNVGELLNEAAEFENSNEDASARSFLEGISLASDPDNFNEKSNSVALMTAHSAKGLEFPVVFIVGMEESLFPHSRSLGEPEQMEEERRLFYVALTRAKERVFLTSAAKRRFFGRERRSIPSVFLKEIPGEFLTSRRVLEHELPASPSLADYHRDRARLSRGGVLGRRLRRTGGYGDEMGILRAGVGEAGRGVLFERGDRVEHPLFGEGVVRAVQGEGEGAKVLIRFPEHGIKRIVAGFRGLRRL